MLSKLRTSWRIEKAGLWTYRDSYDPVIFFFWIPKTGNGWKMQNPLTRKLPIQKIFCSVSFVQDWKVTDTTSKEKKLLRNFFFWKQTTPSLKWALCEMLEAKKGSRFIYPHLDVRYEVTWCGGWAGHKGWTNNCTVCPDCLYAFHTQIPTNTKS